MAGSLRTWVLDEDVASRVLRQTLTEMGCEVLTVKEVIRTGALDPEVIKYVDAKSYGLVTRNKKHFQKLASRHDHSGKYRKASLVYLMCDYAVIEQRLEVLGPILYLEERQALSREDKRIFVTVRDHDICIRR